MKHHVLTFGCRALVCCGISVSSVVALPGDLDLTFGDGGIVTTAIGSGDDEATGVVAQPDGKIVVAGTSFNGTNKDFAVVRYNSDGALDTTFNVTGRVTCDFRGKDDVCNAVVLQDDGRIVVAGYSSNGSRNDIALARYHSDGSLDTGFGELGTGKVVTTGIATNSETWAVALQEDGKLVVVGRVAIDNGRYAVVRYNTDGTIDDGFGSGGLMHIDTGHHDDSGARGVAVQSDGKILVTGLAKGPYYAPYICTARVSADGKSLDSEFGGGMALLAGADGNAVTVQADGRILVADSSFRLMRYNENGSFDTGFGGTGTVDTAIGLGSNIAKSLVLQGDGRIVAAGYSFNANTGFNDFALVRQNPDGTPDTGFHQTGKVTTHIGSGDAYGNSLALQIDGRILVAGSSLVGGKTKFTVARYYGTAQPPIVQTGAATVVTKTSATLNGTVNPNSLETTAYFEYGLDSNYGHVTDDQACGYGLNAVCKSANIRDLRPNTVYHYRLVARNSAELFGGIVYGEDATFTTEPDPPVDVTAAAIGVSSTDATLAAVVFPNGRETSAWFEYGLTTVYDNSTPVQIIPAGTVAMNVFATVTDLVPGATYHFRVMATKSGTPIPVPGLDQTLVANDPPPTVQTGGAVQTTTTGARVSGTVRAHHAASQVFFDFGTDGVSFPISVTLNPAGIASGWRFVGEQQWRPSNFVAGALTTGDRWMEFRPVPGYIGPPNETVSVISDGEATFLQRDYYLSGTAANAGLTVTLKPDSLADPEVPVANRAQWRFNGEDDAQRRDSGVTVNGLEPGTHVIECKPLPGRATPPLTSISLQANVTANRTQTYFLAEAAVGVMASVLPFETVAGNPDLPYAFVGQIRSGLGSSSGFAVKPRVVATAGHVVFDDGTLVAVTGLQWLFQRDRASHEPKPLEPRGFYLFTGYSAQRTAENTPGTSSPASQELDVAALYFAEDASRGGSSGFLASDASENEFLASASNKILVGYPVDGVVASRQGRMHATPPVTDVFARGGSAHTYVTSAIRGAGGMSGGPLCVQADADRYYPAAIYLGGSGQTVVRSIDSQVIELFIRAEVSGNGGGNNTGGGITHSSFTAIGTTADPGAVRISILPEAAAAAGGAWRLSPETSYRASGTQKNGLKAGSYLLQFKPLSGYQTPAEQTLVVSGGQLAQLTFTYQSGLTPLETWRFVNFGTTNNSGPAADTADPDGDGQPNLDEYAAGTGPNNVADVFKVFTAQKTGSTFTATAAGKAGRSYVMERSGGLTGSLWTEIDTTGTLTADGPLTLRDSTAPSDQAFYRLRVSAP